MCIMLCLMFSAHTHTRTDKLSARGRSADAGRDVDSVHKRLVYKRSLFAAAASAIVDVVVASAFVTRDTKEISSSETCNAPYKFHYHFQLFYTFLYVFMYMYT